MSKVWKIHLCIWTKAVRTNEHDVEKYRPFVQNYLNTILHASEVIRVHRQTLSWQNWWPEAVAGKIILKPTMQRTSWMCNGVTFGIPSTAPSRYSERRIVSLGSVADPTTSVARYRASVCLASPLVIQSRWSSALVQWSAVFTESKFYGSKISTDYRLFDSVTSFFQRQQHSNKLLNINTTRNSSGDEIANVNFLYDDTVHALKIQ